MNKNKKKNEGLGGLIASFIVLIIGCGFGLAFLHAKNINNVSEFMTYIHQGSNSAGKCVNKAAQTGEIQCVDKPSVDTNTENNPANNINSQSSDLSDTQLGYSGPAEGQPFLDNTIKKTKKSFSVALDKLNLSKGKSSSFNEASFPHFINSSSNPCWSTKNTILYSQKADGKFIMEDAYRKPTTDMTKACSIKAGTWIDTYTGKKLSVDSVNLDFVIPLQYANNHGASSWDNAKKQEFANDKDNFVVASTSGIAKRHGRTPAKWLPDDDKYACILSKKFISVANKYNLSITENDKNALDKAISKCAK